MSELDQLFAQAIRAKNKQVKGFAITGTVKSIDGDTCTVDDYEDVRLNAIIDTLDSQFTIYPKIGSKVTIARIDNTNNMFIVRASEIMKVTIKIGTQLFEMNNGKFTVKTGSISLKSILNNGFDQLEKAVITTPSGPGKFSPADKLVFADLKNKTNQLLS